jgi:hypothetical protein
MQLTATQNDAYGIRLERIEDNKPMIYNILMTETALHCLSKHLRLLIMFGRY